MSTPVQFTTLLPNEVLARVERMRLSPVKRLTNRQRGEHLAEKGGSSIDFADFRDYVAGDDLRHVDWNIFSRLNHPYLKLYAHEEDMHAVLILDGSTSMAFENKFELGRQLAAALGVMGLTNVERVSVYACSRSPEPTLLPPCTGRQAMKKFFRFLEDLEPGGEITIDAAVELALRRHRGRGIAILISDFLTFGDVTRSFNLLHAAGLEIYGLQILGPSELNPELAGDLRMVDSESQHTLDISSIGELLGIYHEHRLALENHLAAECRRRNGRLLSLSAEEPLKAVLFDKLLRRGWVK
ncbi:MAG: DUF58 domain-containing protein [Planctomyces sp.]|nr:DUF58 domain-containing protein [Planctomyces sp.]